MHQVIAHTRPRYAQSRRGSFCVEANDGHHYWVTLPKADRTSAYKAFAAMIVRACGVVCAEPAQVIVCKELIKVLADSCGPNLENVSFLPGLHYGSKYPADPRRHAIYDLLPVTNIQTIRDRGVFSVMRGISLCLGDADSQHAVFVRQPEKNFSTCIIGLGQSFQFHAPTRSLFSVEQALLHIENTWELTNVGLERIDALSERDLKNMGATIPAEWWATADRSCSQITEQLLDRRAQLPAMLSAIRAQSIPAPQLGTVGSANAITATTIPRATRSAFTTADRLDA
jgi:hypothetical protein